MDAEKEGFGVGCGEFLRVMGVSDTHGMLDGLDDAVEQNDVEVVAIAGDVSPCWLGVDAETYLYDEFFAWVGRHLNTDFVLTPGNHDFVLDPIEGSYSRIMKECPNNLHILIDDGWTHPTSGVRFWGTPWVPKIDGRWAFESADEVEEKDLDERFAKIPRGINVLISHSPPRIADAFVDCSLQRRGGRERPFGSIALTEAIKRSEPTFCVCGHIHSGEHDLVSVIGETGGVTTVYNCSRVDERYEVCYKPTVFQVPYDKRG